MHVCDNLSMYIYICMYVYIYVCMYVCMYVSVLCVCVCNYIYIYVCVYGRAFGGLPRQMLCEDSGLIIVGCIGPYSVEKRYCCNKSAILRARGIVKLIHSSYILRETVPALIRKSTRPS